APLRRLLGARVVLAGKERGAGAVVDAGGGDAAAPAQAERAARAARRAGARRLQRRGAVAAEAGDPGTAVLVGVTGRRVEVAAAADAPGPRQQIAQLGGHRGALRVMPAQRVAQRGARVVRRRRSEIGAQVLTIAARAVGAQRTELAGRRALCE